MEGTLRELADRCLKLSREARKLTTGIEYQVCPPMPTAIEPSGKVPQEATLLADLTTMESLLSSCVDSLHAVQNAIALAPPNQMANAAITGSARA